MKNSLDRQHTSIFGAIAKWWRHRMGNRQGVQELQNLNPRDIDGVAMDAGVNSHDLMALAAKWPESANLLARRLGVLQIDPLQISRTYPAVANDLKRLCSLCATKNRCERDLDRDPSNPVWEKYCPNKQTLRALSDESPTHSGGAR